jgi:DNA repair exonuclease SbcCD nuclease subunit
MPYNLKEREEDFYEAFDEAIQTMVKDHVDAVIHAGDIFDIPKPGGTALVKFLNGLKLLKENEIRFFFTMGEHDISRLPGIPSPFLFKEMDLATYVGDGMPHTYRGLTIVGFHKRRKTEIEALQESLRGLDSQLASVSGKKVLVLHQAMVEFHKYAGELVSSDLPRSFDCYAMGHLHDHFQTTFDGFRGPVCYPGSTDATSSEGIRDYKKGFYITDLSGEEANPNWIQIKSLRSGFAPEFSYEELEEDLEIFAEKLNSLQKKPMLNIRVKGKDIDSARVTTTLKSISGQALYYVWQPVEEGASLGKDLLERPTDIEEQMQTIASIVTGSEEAGSFGIAELLPLLAEDRVDEATDLLWTALKSRRFDRK